MSNRDLGPSLSPSHPLLIKCSDSGWSLLIGYSIELMNHLGSRSECSQRRVNIFSQHVFLHSKFF